MDSIKSHVTYDEKVMLKYIRDMMPDHLFIRNDGKNNCYVYNAVFFDDITDQQVKNNLNLAVGITSCKTMCSAKQEKFITTEGDEGYYLKRPMLKTFEFHVFSAKKSNMDTLNYAKFVKSAVYSHHGAMDVDDEIKITYQTLDNSEIPLTDCSFSARVICYEIEIVECGQMTEALLNTIFLQQNS